MQQPEQPERRRALRPRRRPITPVSSERQDQARRLLQSLGIDEDAVETTIERVRVLGNDPVDWLLVGLETGLARGAARDQSAGGKGRELERLMEGFSTELVKLDEVVDVLATFVNRMRSAAVREEDGDDVMH